MKERYLQNFRNAVGDDEEGTGFPFVWNIITGEVAIAPGRNGVPTKDEKKPFYDKKGDPFPFFVSTPGRLGGVTGGVHHHLVSVTGIDQKDDNDSSGIYVMGGVWKGRTNTIARLRGESAWGNSASINYAPELIERFVEEYKKRNLPNPPPGLENIESIIRRSIPQPLFKQIKQFFIETLPPDECTRIVMLESDDKMDDMVILKKKYGVSNTLFLKKIDENTLIATSFISGKKEYTPLDVHQSTRLLSEFKQARTIEKTKENSKSFDELVQICGFVPQKKGIAENFKESPSIIREIFRDYFKNEADSILDEIITQIKQKPLLSQNGPLFFLEEKYPNPLSKKDRHLLIPKDQTKTPLLELVIRMLKKMNVEGYQLTPYDDDLKKIHWLMQQGAQYYVQDETASSIFHQLFTHYKNISDTRPLLILFDTILEQYTKLPDHDRVLTQQFIWRMLDNLLQANKELTKEQLESLLKYLDQNSKNQCLYYAVKWNKPITVKMLLGFGALPSGPKHKTDYNMSAIILAIELGNQELTRTLLD